MQLYPSSDFNERYIQFVFHYNVYGFMILYCCWGMVGMLTF